MINRVWCSCMAVALLANAAAGSIVVTEPFVGVRHIHRQEITPREIDINILEIDLNAAGISFRLTPPNGPGLSGENTHQTTRAYLIEQNAQMAINASFFYYDPEAPYTKNRGLAASDGVAYSPFDADGRPWPALNITQDNVASIVNRASSALTFATNPPVPLYNAVSGSERIVTNGANTAGQVTFGQPTQLHPRTVAGITADQKLILMTVDGRNAGHSRGMTSLEVADLLISYGVMDAINLDGGGSTTMVMADTAPRVVNVPVGISNVPGSERRNGTNLAVMADHNPGYDRNPSVRLLEDFALSNGRFYRAATFSGSNRGLASSTNAERIAGAGIINRAAQRLTLNTSNPATPGFRLRHLSGGGNPSENLELDATGYIGFYLRTVTPGLQASIGIDDQASSANNTAVGLERSTLVDIIPDGEWHLYQWNLADDSQWSSFSGGNGLIDGPKVTLDSIFISSETNQNAVVYFDGVTYNRDGPIVPVNLLLPGDANRDGRVDGEDFLIWQSGFGMQSGATWADGDFNGDGRVDGEDFLIWQAHFGTTAAGSTAVTPEPASLSVLVVGGLLLARRRIHRRG